MSLYVVLRRDTEHGPKYRVTEEEEVGEFVAATDWYPVSEPFISMAECQTAINALQVEDRRLVGD